MSEREVVWVCHECFPSGAERLTPGAMTPRKCFVCAILKQPSEVRAARRAQVEELRDTVPPGIGSWD